MAFSEPNGPPAWKHLPSWAVVATGDRAAGTDVVRSMAERAGAKITEVEGSHVIMVSQPEAVTDVILEAVAAVDADASERDVSAPPLQPSSRRRSSQIDAGLLDVGYVDGGPADGPAVVLLHGWPYDIHSFADVVPLLAAAGHRVIVPYLRGFGTTRFLSDETLRNGEQAALALDAIALMDALGIDSAIVGGFDWGARSADIVAALWPERCTGLGLGQRLPDRQPGGRQAAAAAEAELQWWYQYYFATERGRAGYDKNRREFAKLIWRHASPKWEFDDATFDRSAASFDNPDHVAVVIHNYRWRLSLADGEAAGCGDASGEARRTCRSSPFRRSRSAATSTETAAGRESAYADPLLG